ncbi:MAG: class I SAM-dependent methyltransferase [Alistipes finegoldii]
MATDYSEFGWSDAQPAFYHELLCKYIERLLPADGTPILDVGCGNGFTANYLAGKGYDVYGIDASRQGIAIANRTGESRPFLRLRRNDGRVCRPNCGRSPLGP